MIITNRKIYRTLPPPYEREILRYAGAPESDEASRALLFSCIEEGQSAVFGAVVYAETDVLICDEDTLGLWNIEVKSRDLCRALSGCARAVLFVATAGAESGRLMARYSRISPSRALMLSAYFSERVERVCDVFQSEYAGVCTPRVSAGYGDIPIELQRDIFTLLCPERSIGVCLTESLGMTPEKSVSAIFGIRS